MAFLSETIFLGGMICARGARHKEPPGASDENRESADIDRKRERVHKKQQRASAENRENAETGRKAGAQMRKMQPGREKAPYGETG